MPWRAGGNAIQDGIERVEICQFARALRRGPASSLWRPYARLACTRPRARDVTLASFRRRHGPPANNPMRAKCPTPLITFFTYRIRLNYKSICVCS
ncbi:unnamed protein product [Pieris brassicae]|uniref:Uncharacterized protein n=1 Tax=Pieris brassicae TaxID=7116 RepID=A0A9P0TY88_PIEBR|nr:unnamed protein product [Pieris brassicae]